MTLTPRAFAIQRKTHDLNANEKIGQRVRWKILGELPFVADVMVNIAVESKPCPAMSSLRPQEDIEQVGFVVGRRE